ncbi:MAG: endonuclease/exonuclease/phosphatase family protein [Firmicutes bacterium]|nr:endonuclease/exonuclease/phosphatase family protein [Bacillota bacterium]
MKKRVSPAIVVLRIILTLILILVFAFGAYAAYLFIDYHRIEDNQVLDISGTGMEGEVDVSSGKTYHLTDWNIGFAAYTDQFSFFMDGGKYSRAFSEEDTVSNMNAIINELKAQDSDFYLIQEVDFGSTRSYNVDERAMMEEAFSDSYTGTFGVNYDSSYLFYPPTSPIGASKSGLLTMSSSDINDSVRRSFPIQTGFAKFLDLDRCYTVNRILCSDGHDLVLINLHASAYTTDDTIVRQQLAMLLETIEEEYAEGNYVIAGGDFNMDLLGNSGFIFGVSGADYSWAQPFPEDMLPDNVELYAPYDPMFPVPSCRNADSPWNPETNFQITIDGFLITDNIEVVNCEVTDQQFAYSDHQMVQLMFKFK